MAAFQYSTAQLPDASWIADFQIHHALEVEHLELNPATVLRGVTQIFKMPDVGFYYACRTEFQKPAACALILKEWSDWRAKWVWWVHSVYVAKEFRGNRIFETMYAHLREKAVHEQAAGLRLYVDKTNTRAQHIYQKIGMSKEHYEMFEDLF